MFRKPKTTNERRANAAHLDLEDFGIHIRAKRRAKTLVNSFSDRDRTWDRSWKRTRRNQWK